MSNSNNNMHFDNNSAVELILHQKQLDAISNFYWRKAVLASIMFNNNYLSCIYYVLLVVQIILTQEAEDNNTGQNNIIITNTNYYKLRSAINQY